MDYLWPEGLVNYPTNIECQHLPSWFVVKPDAEELLQLWRWPTILTTDRVEEIDRGQCWLLT